MHYIFLEYKGQTAELDVMCECYSHRTKQFLEAYRSHLLDTISCSCLLVETSQWVDSRATHKCVTANGCFPVKFRIHSCHEDSTHVYDLQICKRSCKSMFSLETGAPNASEVDLGPTIRILGATARKTTKNHHQKPLIPTN